jgi:hypothetical protein
MAPAPPTSPRRLGRPLPFPLRPIKCEPEPHLHPAPLPGAPPLLHRATTGAPPPPPPRRPDLLLRRRSHPFKPVVKILALPSSFWCFSRAFWCPGGQLGSSPASPPPPPPLSGRRRRRLQAASAVRSKSTALIKRAAYPFTRPVHTLTSSLASAQPTASRHVSPPQSTRRLHWQFCKKNPEIPEITNIPFHLYKNLTTRS